MSIPTRTAYCTTDDLLLGGIPIPDYVNPAAVVFDAADEIDSQIGFRYDTPVDISDDSDVPRPVKLLLKRLNSHLASGRLITELSSPEEDNRVHQYGLMLIEEVHSALIAISKGTMDLPGVGETTDFPIGTPGPAIMNMDSESNVEAFYNRLANPYYSFWGGYGERWPVNPYGQ